MMPENLQLRQVPHVSCPYISQDPRLRKEYFDPDLVVDEDIKKRLMEGGMDDIFIRWRRLEAHVLPISGL
jgi:hypothetical protein